MPLLVELLETLRSNPHLTPASLVERYRDSENHRYLLKLMGWTPPGLDDDGGSRIFKDAMTSLANKEREQHTDNLLQKARDEGLSEEEKVELQRLLRDRSGR